MAATVVAVAAAAAAVVERWLWRRRRWPRILACVMLLLSPGSPCLMASSSLSFLFSFLVRQCLSDKMLLGLEMLLSRVSYIGMWYPSVTFLVEFVLSPVLVNTFKMLLNTSGVANISMDSRVAPVLKLLLCYLSNISALRYYESGNN